MSLLLRLLPRLVIQKLVVWTDMVPVTRLAVQGTGTFDGQLCSWNTVAVSHHTVDRKGKAKVSNTTFIGCKRIMPAYYKGIAGVADISDASRTL